MTRPRSSGDRTLTRTGALHALPSEAFAETRLRRLQDIPVKAQPRREQVAVARLQPGVRIGWLTVIVKAAGGGSPVLSRCDCGALLTPLARDLSEGKWLHCGLVYDPDTRAGHGWSGPSPVRREELVPLAA